MTHDLSLKEIQKEWHGTLKSYVIGFLASFLLTAISFSLVITRLFSEQTLIYAIICLAILQAIVQLLFFLHIGQEEAKPRWASIVFCFTVLILLIVVIGSLWIMYDLNDRMMPDMIREMPHD
jgi:cytochrome o ubiquinol oxidase operon protein cyoD